MNVDKSSINLPKLTWVTFSTPSTGDATSNELCMDDTMAPKYEENDVTGDTQDIDTAASTEEGLMILDEIKPNMHIYTYRNELSVQV